MPARGGRSGVFRAAGWIAAARKRAWTAGCRRPSGRVDAPAEILKPEREVVCIQTIDPRLQQRGALREIALSARADDLSAQAAVGVSGQRADLVCQGRGILNER